MLSRQHNSLMLRSFSRAKLMNSSLRDMIFTSFQRFSILGPRVSRGRIRKQDYLPSPSDLNSFCQWRHICARKSCPAATTEHPSRQVLVSSAHVDSCFRGNDTRFAAVVPAKLVRAKAESGKPLIAGNTSLARLNQVSSVIQECYLCLWTLQQRRRFFLLFHEQNV